MTVTYKGEIAQRSATNRAGIRTYQRVFRLTTDDRTDTAYDVGSHASLPVLGAAFSDDANAFCHMINVRNTEPWKIWQVTAEYTTERQIGSDGGTNQNPETDEILTSFTSEIYQEEVFQDVNGAPLANTAGDLFLDPPPTKDVGHLIARIMANVSVVPPWVLSYQSAVNSGPMVIGGLSIGAGLGKVQRIEIGHRERRGDFLFFPLTLEIHMKRDGWRYRPLNAGFRELDRDAIETHGVVVPKQIKNKADGELISTPAPLDIDGFQIEEPTTTNVHYLDFQLYPELPFSGILPGVS